MYNYSFYRDYRCENSGHGVSPNLTTVWFLSNPTTTSSVVNSTSTPYSVYREIERILYTRVVLVLCCIGIVGNVVNLSLLIPRAVRTASGRIEKFAYTGLIMLGFSDICFCLTISPHTFLTPRSVVDSLTFDLVYKVYATPVINTFTTTSTWLTVVLALGRYIAVCRPLAARQLIGLSSAQRSIAAVFLLCVLFNLPRYWAYAIKSDICPDGSEIYFRFYGWLKLNPKFEQAYMWLYFGLFIVVPLATLAFCNLHLILALRASQKSGLDLRAPGQEARTRSQHLTLTLIVIVILYLLLGSPAEVITFLRWRVLSNKNETDAFNLGVAIVNTLQAANFALNFLPYWIINAYVRRAIVRFLKLPAVSLQRSLSRSGREGTVQVPLTEVLDCQTVSSGPDSV